MLDLDNSHRSVPSMGATLYAFTNEFLARQYDLDGLLNEVAKRNIGPGVELVGFQSLRDFPVISDEFAEDFKRRLSDLGLHQTALGINADQEIRRGRIASTEEMVAYHQAQMRAAAKLGFPIVRYQYGATPLVIEQLAPLAEDLGLKLGLEIHAPQHAEHPDVISYREMYARVNCPALGWIPDFSSTAKRVPPSYIQSFRDSGVPEGLIELALSIWSEDGDTRARMTDYKERADKAGFSPMHYNPLSLIFAMFGKQDPRSWLPLMDQVVHIHGKFFGFDEDGREEAIDYEAILPLFVEAGYIGTISSEWEGHMYSTANAFDLVERHQTMCRSIMERH